MWWPVGRFRIDAAVLFKHIFHEERHDVGQSDGRLLRIGETGHRPVFDQRGTTGMALFTLRAAEEVRAAQFGIAEGELDAELVAIAKAIIAQRTGSFDPTTYRDRYQEALQELIEAKMKGLTVKPREIAARHPSTRHRSHDRLE